MDFHDFELRFALGWVFIPAWAIQAAKDMDSFFPTTPGSVWSMDAGHLKGRANGNVFAAVGLNSLRHHLHVMFSFQ